MTRINVRNKGAIGEREVADILQAVVNKVAANCGYEAPRIRRNVEQTQVGGEDLVGLPWYSFEVKRVEKVDLDKWWKQTVTQAARKAAGANSWDSQVAGGWKKVAAEGVAARAVVGVGAEAGNVPVRVGGGWAASCEAAVPANLVGYLAAQAGNEGLPVPVWVGGQANSLKMGLDKALGEYEKALRSWSQLTKASDLLPGRLMQVPIGFATANTSVEMNLSKGRSNVATSPNPSETPNAKKALSVMREPVLIWRQNRQPWAVRFCANIVCINGLRVVSVVDTTLETWLEVFRNDLETRLRG